MLSQKCYCHLSVLDHCSHVVQEPQCCTRCAGCSQCWCPHTTLSPTALQLCGPAGGSCCQQGHSVTVTRGDPCCSGHCISSAVDPQTPLLLQPTSCSELPLRVRCPQLRPHRAAQRALRDSATAMINNDNNYYRSSRNFLSN